MGVIGGTVEVIILRGGFAQQRAYARFHVNYSFWDTIFRGHFDVLEKILTEGTTDITLVLTDSPGKIDVRITTPNLTGGSGQYYIKFHGPVYNQS